MLKIKNLCFNFEKNRIIDNLSLHVQKGETVALIGSSGSGKTTLLRLICGALRPQSGIIETERHAHAYMSQQDLLLPWRTVFENVTLSLELEKRRYRTEDIEQLLASLEIDVLAKRYPHELSGGQYKRAMLARALALKKETLLLDEAFSALDLPLRDKLYSYLREYNRATTLLVTHDFRDAFYLANRILLLNQGRIDREWLIKSECRKDPVYIGHLFSELTAALSLSTMP